MTETIDPADVIKTINQRQEQLLEDLDILNERIEAIIESYSRNRSTEQDAPVSDAA